jgi:excisionase family DNA binding protein
MALRGKKEQNEQEDSKTIEISAQMQGSITFNDPVNLKINGHFNGSLETKGSLTIGNKAYVESNIVGDNIVIAGKLNGDITANKMLVLMPTAVLTGNISTPKLNIVEGAIFQGNCRMTESLLNIDEVAKYLEIDLAEIEELANSGKIPAMRSGNNWKFERGQIDNWAASGKVK